MTQKLSIIVPVYNEHETILKTVFILDNLTLINDFSKEIIIVDDGSTDGTRDLLEEIKKTNHSVLFHDKNYGKGTAIRTGLKEASGDYVVVQDADLEYDSHDFNIMLDKMLKENLSVVYGSRELKKQKNRYSSLTFYWGGIFLTKVTNLLFNQNLTDEATCYKMFKTNLIKNLPLQCKKFEFCPEVTALVALSGLKIVEVGISYHPRSKAEGKKIQWRDGWQALLVLLKYRFTLKSNNYDR